MRRNAMKLPRRKFFRLAAGVTALPALPRIARAQIYPTRPIRVIIPFPPGGSYDAIGRPWADRMKALLGTVVVENQGGASGTLGAATVARAQPDGHTLLLAGSGQLGVYKVMATRPAYDPINDLRPITVAAVTCYAIAVHPSVPAKNLMELVAYAKTNPRKLSFGSAGAGGMNHLSGELFKTLTKTDIQHVPYRGAGPAIADALSGQIPIVVPATNGQLIEFHRSGKLRVLAVASPNRLIGAPEIPTGIEAGVPDWIVQNYIALVAPAGTPETIVERLNEATRIAFADEKLQQQFIASGFEPPPDRSPDVVRRWVDEEIVRWTPIVKALGLTLD
jgi:tripartite-type tricarboxylate transporter receptor subunit TctC